MGTKKGQPRKTARRAYKPPKRKRFTGKKQYGKRGQSRTQTGAALREFRIGTHQYVTGKLGMWPHEGYMGFWGKQGYLSSMKILFSDWRKGWL